MFYFIFFFFFFQAEDGIRDYKVTGVQTCALPISPVALPPSTTSSWLMAKSTVPTSSAMVTVFRRCVGWAQTRRSSRQVLHVGVLVTTFSPGSAHGARNLAEWSEAHKSASCLRPDR